MYLKAQENLFLLNDMNREIAPLKQAEDAIYVDSSDMTIEEVVECICDYAK